MDMDTKKHQTLALGETKLVGVMVSLIVKYV